MARLVHAIATLERPRWLVRALCRAFAWHFRIGMDDVIRPVGAYVSLMDFFLRELRPETRPVDARPDAAVSPADALVTAAGIADGGHVVLVKGTPYSFAELLGRRRDEYDGGCFVMLYLSPADCHRFYAPYDSSVAASWRIDGLTLPVYPAAVAKRPHTFVTNRRIVTELDTARGKIAFIAIGATNVGRVVVNHPVPPAEGRGHTYRKGGEFGRFELGSSIVLLFERGRFRLADGMAAGRAVRIGQCIARCC